MRELDLNGEDGKAISRIVGEYEKINRRFIPPILLEKIKKYYAEGLAEEVIIRAFEITAQRGAHWEYTEGILKRLLDEGITTIYSWDKKVLFKKNIAKLKNMLTAELDDKELNRLALYMTFREELKYEEDKLKAYLANPEPIDIEIVRFSDEERAERKRAMLSEE